MTKRKAPANAEAFFVLLCRWVVNGRRAVFVGFDALISTIDGLGNGLQTSGISNPKLFVFFGNNCSDGFASGVFAVILDYYDDVTVG